MKRSKPRRAKMKTKRNPSLDNCRHGAIDATCTKCWPKGNILAPKPKEKK